MRIRSALVLACGLLLVQAASAQEIKDHTLTVRGKVQVYAKADRATIRFDIKGVGSTLKAAFDQARATLDTITQQLFAIGLTPDNFSTSFFRNEENFGNKAFLSSRRDYRALLSVKLMTDKMDSLDAIAVILAANRIEKISAISFELVNIEGIRQSAVVQASRAAKQKADWIATALDLECTDVLEISEQTPMDAGLVFIRGGRAGEIYEGTPINDPLGGLELGSWGKGSIYPEEIRFDCEVRVVYAVKPAAAKAP